MRARVIACVAALALSACDTPKCTRPNCVKLIDASPISSWDGFTCPGLRSVRSSICNPLTQTGCCAPEKCTWYIDATAPTPLGHIDCAPEGVIPLGGACTYGPPGTMGFDNCV